jgi:hypothetical protein
MKAVELAKSNNIDNFKGNPSWCYRFMKQPSAQERILQVGPLVPASVVRVPGMPFWISLSYEGSLSAYANL